MMSQTISAAQLKAIAGAGARADLMAAIVRGWPTAVAKAGLTTRLRAAHFLAQIMTETGGLEILEESGAYRAPRILEIFGEGRHSAKVTPAEAKRIAALPVAQRGPVLFNRVYGVGNPTKMREFNNTGPNDGWLYRGGGMMQATGKSNYAAMEKKTGLPLVAHPELLHQPDSAFTAAYLEWAQGGRCNAAADRDDVVEVRRIINGGKNGLKECRRYLAAAKQALADYGGSPSAAPPVDVAPGEQVDIWRPEPVDAPMAQPAPVDGAQGDPEIFSVQQRLKAMNYAPGVVTGVWGGMTAGAIAGFINDRGADIAVPASLEQFNVVRDELKGELGRAEAEHFVRPVSQARANADAEVVTKVAPEAAPVRRNMLTSAWAAVTAFATAVWSASSDKLQAAWDFLTDHKDDIPSDPGVLSTAWSYVERVPTSFWWLLAAGALAFIALDASRGLAKIREAVQTGVRQ
jgi:predicted chitinase